VETGLTLYYAVHDYQKLTKKLARSSDWQHLPLNIEALGVSQFLLDPKKILSGRGSKMTKLRFFNNNDERTDTREKRSAYAIDTFTLLSTHDGIRTYNALVNSKEFQYTLPFKYFRALFEREYGIFMRFLWIVAFALKHTVLIARRPKQNLFMKC